MIREICKDETFLAQKAEPRANPPSIPKEISSPTNFVTLKAPV